MTFWGANGNQWNNSVSAYIDHLVHDEINRETLEKALSTDSASGLSTASVAQAAAEPRRVPPAERTAVAAPARGSRGTLGTVLATAVIAVAAGAVLQRIRNASEENGDGPRQVARPPDVADGPGAATPSEQGAEGLTA